MQKGLVTHQQKPLHSLPTELQESDITLGQFWQAIKTHLFGHWQLQCRVTVFFVRCVQICFLTYFTIDLGQLNCWHKYYLNFP